MRKKNSKNNPDETQSNLSQSGGAKFTDMFDIPQSALGGNTHVELSSNREALVSGCQGVLVYDESEIKLATAKMSIRFLGRGLQIKVLTHDSAVVAGFFTSIEFIV